MEPASADGPERNVRHHRPCRTAARAWRGDLPTDGARIATKPPQRINLDLLAALCDILSCTPNDLLELVAEQVREAPAVNDSGPGIGDLRPIRATIRRPDNQ